MELTGWKPAPLSRAAGMGETAVRDLFRKRSSPKVSTAKALAAAMGMTVDHIIDLGEGTATIEMQGGASTGKQRIMALWDHLSPDRRHLLEGYIEYLASQEEVAAGEQPK
ncbi:helix-turn-helix domain-containing protein [Paracoccus sp. (in: a-proteobacteria)]|uniref:helix-turn-helix domain-containing protein n=1 Tax=Paracoccus sp. TaxID=267 RepID=UPI00396CF5F3